MKFEPRTFEDIASNEEILHALNLATRFISVNRDFLRNVYDLLDEEYEWMMKDWNSDPVRYYGEYHKSEFAEASILPDGYGYAVVLKGRYTQGVPGYDAPEYEIDFEDLINNEEWAKKIEENIVYLKLKYGGKNETQ